MAKIERGQKLPLKIKRGRIFSIFDFAWTKNAIKEWLFLCNNL